MDKETPYTNIDTDIDTDKQYIYKENDEDAEEATGMYQVRYMTYYALNQRYIWTGIAILFFMAFYYILLFSVYLRTMAYCNNICAPFSAYDYDIIPCTNYISKLYWDNNEAFENRTPSIRKSSKEKGVLGNIQDGWQLFLLLPRSIWNIFAKIENASNHINREIEHKFDPYYYRFADGLNRAVKSLDTTQT